MEKKTKYWEQKYYSRLQETLETRNTERIRELIQQQFLTEIEYLKDTIKDLEEEKGNLVKVIERVQEEYRKGRYFTFNKGRNKQLVGQNIVNYTEQGTQLELYQKLLTDKMQECEILRANSSDTTKLNTIIGDLNRKLGILKEENRVYMQQIQVLIVRLSMLLGKPLEVLRPQIEELTDLLKTEVPQPKETLEESGVLMLEAANDKVRILQLELKLQEDKFNKLRKDDAAVIYLLKEKIRKLKGVLKLFQREKEGLEGYRYKVEAKRYDNKVDYEEKAHYSGNSEIENTYKRDEVWGDEVKHKKSIRLHKEESFEEIIEDESFSTILSKWEQAANNNVRIKLLEKILVTPKLLKESIEQYLKEYLLILNQAFGIKSSLLSCTAIHCLSEILERRKLDIEEFNELKCNKNVIDALNPQRFDESDDKFIQRHTAALNVLSYMKNLNIQWNESMTKYLIDSNALTAIENYLKNFDVMEKAAIKASYAATYIASYNENLSIIKKTNIHNAVMDIINVSRSRELLENAVECLTYLLKDMEIVKSFEQDTRITILIAELSIEPIQSTHTNNILECLTSLSKSNKSLGILLCYEDLGKALGKILSNKDVIISALKLIKELCHLECSKEFIQNLITPLANSLDPFEEVTVKALEVVKEIIKCDEGRLLGEYAKLLVPVFNCTKSSNKRVSDEAFKVHSLLTGYSTKKTLDKIDEDLISKCIDNYCNNEDLEVRNATQSLIKTYINKGDEKNVKKLVSPELLKSVILNLTVDDMNIQKSALEILTKLLDSPECIRIATELKETKVILDKFITVISVPVALKDKEMYYSN